MGCGASKIISSGPAPSISPTNQADLKLEEIETYVALYDYEARVDKDLSLNREDYLEILEKTEVGKKLNKRFLLNFCFNVIARLVVRS
jgi:SH3 domain